MMKEIFTYLLTVLSVLFSLSTEAQVQTGVWRTPSGNTDYHHFTRNNSGGAAVYINQVSTGPILRLSSGENAANKGVKLTVENDGSMGIGTTNTGAWKLAVNGNIRAKEVKVETGWSDFVFDEGYELSSLKEVEEHIKEKGHLKDIPSAKEVEKEGVFLGEMDAKLLQKIEELTLYILQLNKKIEIQQQQIEQLKKRNKE
ncbi:hypothetical protein [Sinomicrobium weinanense]|uniref:BZIP transcription factor n=1 Tax=Sinomicrobium weinanense TaxID=2842200 RepID=A0A926JR61_9FLAO|nr:hypothetical protein [Sinomicrobium weinanense]MBC9795859.1 hypothetical protein [Sinomicrobium weinanense]MBU3125379.1 hypothetical protein [Sinomicrobium weinanense]